MLYRLTLAKKKIHERLGGIIIYKRMGVVGEPDEGVYILWLAHMVIRGRGGVFAPYCKDL